MSRESPTINSDGNNSYTRKKMKKRSLDTQNQHTTAIMELTEKQNQQGSAFKEVNVSKPHSKMTSVSQGASLSTMRLREANRGLANENLALRKYLNLVLENCDLNTANVLATVMSRCDDRLKTFLMGQTNQMTYASPRDKDNDKIAPSKRSPKRESNANLEATPPSVTSTPPNTRHHPQNISFNEPDAFQNPDNKFHADMSSSFNASQRSSLQPRQASEWSSSYSRPQSTPPVSPSYGSAFHSISMKDFNTSDPGAMLDPTQRSKPFRGSGKSGTPPKMQQQLDQSTLSYGSSFNPMAIREFNTSDPGAISDVEQRSSSFGRRFKGEIYLAGSSQQFDRLSPSYGQSFHSISTRDFNTSDPGVPSDFGQRSRPFGRSDLSEKFLAGSNPEFAQVSQSYRASFKPISMREFHTSDQGVYSQFVQTPRSTKPIQQSDNSGMSHTDAMSKSDHSPSYGKPFSTLGTNDLAESDKVPPSSLSPRNIETDGHIPTQGKHELGKTFICDGCQTRSPRSTRAEKKQVSFDDDGQFEISYPDDLCDDEPDHVFCLSEQEDRNQPEDVVEPILAGSVKDSLETTYTTVATHQSSNTSSKNLSVEEDSLNVPPNAPVYLTAQTYALNGLTAHQNEPTGLITQTNAPNGLDAPPDALNGLSVHPNATNGQNIQLDAPNDPSIYTNAPGGMYAHPNAPGVLSDQLNAPNDLDAYTHIPEGRPTIVAVDDYPEVAPVQSRELPEAVLQCLSARRETENSGVTKQMIGSPQAASTPIISPQNGTKDYLANKSPRMPPASPLGTLSKRTPVTTRPSSAQSPDRLMHNSPKDFSDKSSGYSRQSSARAASVQSLGRSSMRSSSVASPGRSGQSSVTSSIIQSPSSNSMRGPRSKSPVNSGHNSTKASRIQSPGLNSSRASSVKRSGRTSYNSTGRYLAKSPINSGYNSTRASNAQSAPVPGRNGRNSVRGSNVPNPGYNSSKSSNVGSTGRSGYNSTKGSSIPSPSDKSDNSKRGSSVQSSFTEKSSATMSSVGTPDVPSVTHRKAASDSTSWATVEPSDAELLSVLGLEGKGASEKAHHVFHRAVDILTDYHPTLTPELTGSISKARPNRRIVGEIAFQLDRRILDHVFEMTCLGKSKRKSRYYGYSVANIDHLIAKESNRFGDGQKNIEEYLHTKLDALISHLAKCSYDMEHHSEFTQEMVNKYGLLNGIPEDLESSHVDGAWLDDTAALRLLIGRLLLEEEELHDMLITLDCLCLMAHDDNKPLVIL